MAAISGAGAGAGAGAEDGLSNSRWKNSQPQSSVCKGVGSVRGVVSRFSKCFERLDNAPSGYYSRGIQFVTQKRPETQEICMRFLKGNCRFGERCKYLHDRTLLVDDQSKGIYQKVLKSLFCRSVFKGSACSQLDSCQYAHSRTELQTHPQLPPTYKTKLCRIHKRNKNRWDKDSHCLDAHGKNELKTAQRMRGSTPGKIRCAIEIGRWNARIKKNKL